MRSSPVHGDIGPDCSKCQGSKVWCGTRWLCRPCQAKANRTRKASLSDEQREVERIRANQLRNARTAMWSPEKREAARLYSQAWREENAERHRENARDWYARHADHVRAQKAADYLANPERFIAATHRRKARMLEQVCDHGAECVDDKFLWSIYAADCTYCGAKAEHADHYYPLARGGLHCRENIVPACDPCNRSKHARDPIEWLESRTA